MTTQTYSADSGWAYAVRTIGVLVAIAIIVALFYYYTR